MRSWRFSEWRVGETILRRRAVIGLGLLAVTAFMAYWAAHVRIATNFEDFFPASHPNVRLYRKYQHSYGGAHSLILLLRVRKGDIFNFATLNKIQSITRDVNVLPGVDHNEIFSLASYRVAFTKSVPGALIAKCFMYPRVPRTSEELAELERNVLARRGQLQGLVTADNKGALVTAGFNERGLDYGALFKGIESIVERYQDSNTDIYLAGEPVVAGWGYHYLKVITAIFVTSLVIMLAILYLSLGRRSSWWAPILTGTFSAIWGLGFVGLMGYNFDPVMLVIPFILTARDLSHGIQWQGRYYDELDRLDDKYMACATTTDVMLPPGLLSIIADIAGIIFISLGGIPVLKHIGFAGAVWLAGSVTMVFIFQPIFMSFLPRPRVKTKHLKLRAAEGALSRRARAALDWLVRVPVTPGVVRAALLAGGGAFIVWGVASGQRAKIGYETPGTPLYRPQAKVNQDIKQIGRYFPTDEGWVVLTMPDYPSPQSGLGPAVLRMEDDLRHYLLSRKNVLAVVSFSGVIRPFDQMFHYSHPKYNVIPQSVQLAGNLWWMAFGGTAPGEMEHYFSHNPKMIDTCIRVLLPDHTYTRLNELQREIAAFVKERIKSDPLLDKVRVHYLGGEAGLYAAANDVLYELDLINITFVLGVIYLCCAFSFSSPLAGALFIVSCIMANFGAFVYMAWRNIGLTIDTIPVISLGIGLGIDYGIYTVARIRDEVLQGAKLEDAITTALRTTGGAVFSTFAVMIGGVLPWAFSPLLFHNEMSVLLIFLMGTNMIAGVLILPSFIAWRRPRFITRYEQPVGAEAAPVAAGRAS